MDNQQLAEIFEDIANLLEIKGEVIYKVLAYRRAGESLRELGQDISHHHQQGTLKEIPGIGKAISEKIQELLETGELAYYQELTAEVPGSLIELLEVPGLGPKRVALFWKELGLTTLPELAEAASAGQLRQLEGIGPKTEANILKGIEALQRRTDRILLGDALPFARRLLDTLREIPGVERAEAGGSLRRRAETVGDLDLLAAAADSGSVMAGFLGHPEVKEIISQGDIKSSVVFANGLRAQLWVHPPENYGTALQYATGAKDHNVRLRELARSQGYSLSEHGLAEMEGGQEHQFRTERGVYRKLGLPWIPPELREDRGEIQAAQSGELPELITVEDIQAELHSHTTWSDGRNTLRDMAEAAQARGYRVLAVTDHSGSLGIAGGLSPRELLEQREEIRELQQELGENLVLLAGVELEILADGSLDFDEQVLAGFDIVVASLHTSMRQPRGQITQRLLNAIRSPHVDIIAHPTNRLLGKREAADLDMDAVLEAAAEYGVALEINANPQRLDLNDVYARRAGELGIPLAVNTDAHEPDHLDYLPFGTATARRAWLKADQVINTWDVDRLLSWLEHRS